MDRDQALERVLEFEQRISDLANAGPSGNFKVQWKIIENDVDDFNEKAFAQGSPDYDKLHSALHPMVFGVGGDPWMSLLSDAKFLMERLQVIEHRLTQGQSAMKSPQEDEILIQPGTPHSAYVKLRDIVESASRSLMLIDPYVDRTLFVLLANTQPGVNVRILTRKANLPGDFLLEAGKFKQQYAGSLEVRHGLTDLHDRFLLADDQLFYSGASFKDLGKKGSMVGEIQDVKTEMLNHLESQWKQGTPVV